jgi:hypothetical protein
MNSESNKSLEVANTIRQQLGHKCLRMLGAQDLVGGENSLQFKIRGSRKVNKIRIVLDASDTYTVSFYKSTGHYSTERTVKEIASFEGVYADQLHKLIESTTGLYTSI